MTAATARDASQGSSPRGNPALRSDAARDGFTTRVVGVRTMSVVGVSIKTLILLALVVAGGAWGWASATRPVAAHLGHGVGNTTVTIPGGFWLVSILALVLGFMTAMNPRRAPVTAPLYALAEGYILGAVSAAFNAQTEGIVSAAVLATLCVFVAALLLYATRIVRPTQRMAFGVTTALIGLLFFWSFAGLVSILNWGWLYSDSFRTIGIIVGVLSIVLAALSLTLDFAVIEAGVEAGAPARMEWYSAYGLTVTLVWLYFELLRLLDLLAQER